MIVRRSDECPKQMRFGPCGGAREDHGCEVADVVCPFLRGDGPVLPAAGRTTNDPRPSAVVPRFLVDFRPDPTIEWELEQACELLRAVGATALIGDHVDDVTPHRPSAVAAAVAAHGVPVVSTLTCRNRTLGEIGEELDRLAAIELLVAIHCLTGDHPAARFGVEQVASFPLDSFELLGLAGLRRAPLSVAESPAGAPASWRPQRLAAKAAAGASMAVINHAGDVGDLVAFADDVHALAPELALVAPVPVIADRRSAEALVRFPGLRLPARFVDDILAADDPAECGHDKAVAMATDLLATGRFAGVNLSGAATTGAITDRMALMTAILADAAAGAG